MATGNGFPTKCELYTLIYIYLCNILLKYNNLYNIIRVVFILIYTAIYIFFDRAFTFELNLIEYNGNLSKEEEKTLKKDNQMNSSVFTTTQAGTFAARHRRFPIGNIIFYGVLIALIIAVYFFGSIQGSRPRSLFGFSIYTVLTDSMSPEIPKGSLVLSKYADPKHIKVGEDITYLREDFSTVTHRVVDILENYNNSGIRGFLTKGINNNQTDESVVHPDNILGVVVFHVAGGGSLLAYIQHHPFVIIVLGVILISLIYTLRYLYRTHNIGKNQKKSNMV